MTAVVHLNVPLCILTWRFYFLATHPEVQEKALQEIKKELRNQEVDHTNIESLPYIRQIVEETLRCAVIAPYAARFQDFDSELGGHKIPKNTPVIHALGVSLSNEKYWPLPNKFDPDRFSPENIKKRPPLSFQPFGFAGKRVCPGYRFAYAEATVCLVTLLRIFKIKLVDGQVVNPVYGVITHPEEEIWIKLEKR
ncbi:cytochrome P450 20A1-like [Pecten maximus]|uniref:cytochrome P450 20A1-like n=1 Tax=Pecten maximus TaxID=6579 RepID=UPI0014581512|nr:cytochrome P450 20A1-like [Pecten maximus]